MKKLIPFNTFMLSLSFIIFVMLVSPVTHSSAQNDIQLKKDIKTQRATISTIDSTTNTITVTIDGTIVTVLITASTTVFLGDGSQVELSSLRTNGDVYLFGTYTTETRIITATTIIIRNKSITARVGMSRAERNANN